jgi:hypothetical protein
MYRALCVSHDPALTSGEVHSGSWSDQAGMEAALAHLIEEARTEHPNCRLLIGRYSYPLIQVGCPANNPSCTRRHREVEWIGSGWLRILIDAGDQVGNWHQPVIDCWSRELVLPLASELRAL